jgi:hypothetical protein
MPNGSSVGRALSRFLFHTMIVYQPRRYVRAGVPKYLLTSRYGSQCEKLPGWLSMMTKLARCCFGLYQSALAIHRSGSRVYCIRALTLTCWPLFTVMLLLVQ